MLVRSCSTGQQAGPQEPTSKLRNFQRAAAQSPCLELWTHSSLWTRISHSPLHILLTVSGVGYKSDELTRGKWEKLYWGAAGLTRLWLTRLWWKLQQILNDTCSVTLSRTEENIVLCCKSFSVRTRFAASSGEFRSGYKFLHCFSVNSDEDLSFTGLRSDVSAADYFLLIGGSLFS